MDQHQEIARIAYELFLMRGGIPGDPVADWVTAERLFAERLKSQTVHIVDSTVATETNFEIKATTIEDKSSSTFGIEMEETKPVRARKIAVKKEAAPVAPKKVEPKAEAKVEPVKAEPVKEV